MATYFSGALWKRNLSRFWPLAAISFLIALFVFVVPELTSYRDAWLYISQKDILSDLAVYCAIVVPIMSIFSAIAVFGYLHNPRAAGFVSSLPVTRLGLYITNWLSGLTLVFVPTLLVSVFYGLQLIGQPVPSGDFLRWLGAMFTSYLVFFSMAAFFTFLTGNPIMQAFLYGIFNFLFVMLYGIMSFVAEMLVFGYSDYASSSISTLLAMMTPPVAIYGMIDNMTRYTSFSTFGISSSLSAALLWVIYLVFAALMAFFGYLLYRRRRIEATGDIILHKPIRSVFKYLMGLLIGAVLAFLLTQIMLDGRAVSASELLVRLTVSTMFFGALGCFCAEMIIKKRLRVWKTAYKGIIIFIAAIAAIALFIRFDGTGYERRAPDPDNVVSVSFSTRSRFYSPLHGEVNPYSTGGEGWSLQQTYIERQRALGLLLINNEVLDEIKLRTPDYFESPEAIIAAVKLHQTIIGEKRSLEPIQGSWGNNRFFLTYTLKNGKTMTRDYVLPLSKTPTHSSVELLLELYNQPEAVNKRNRFMSLGDDAILGATVTPAFFDGSWLSPYQYHSRGYHSSTLLPEGDLRALMQTLHQDAAAGSLGRIRHLDLQQQFLQGRSDFLCLIDLYLDSDIAGVPAAFSKESLHSEDGVSIFNSTVLTIVVNKDHINTIRVLVDLGLLP